MNNQLHPSFALRIALIFAIVTAVWILVSNQLVALLATDVSQLAFLGTVQGWLRVAVITVLLYVLLRHEENRRQQVAAELQAAQRFAQTTIDALGAHLCVLDQSGTIEFVNRAWRAFAEANPPTPFGLFVGYNYLEVCDRAAGPGSGEAARFAAGLRAVMNGDLDQFTLEYPCHAPQEQRWFTGQVTRFTHNGAVHLAVAHENITERKLAELALHESEARFATIFQHAPLAMKVMRAADYQLIDVNEQWERLTGFTREQALGRTPFDLQTPVDPAAQQRLYDVAHEQGTALDFEMPLRRATGAIAQISFSTVRINLNGEPCLLSMLTDVTERQHMEQALRDSERRYRAVVEDQSEVIIRYRSDNTILFVNEATCRFFGQSESELLGKRWRPETPPDELPLIRTQLAALSPDNPVVQIENRVVNGQGELRWMHFTNRGLFNEASELIEMQTVGRDITALHQFTETLRQYAERLKVLHEIGRASLAGRLPQDIASLTLDLLQQLLPFQRGTITWINPQTQDAVGVTKINDRLSDAHRSGAVADAAEQQLTINLPLQAHNRLIGTLNLQADRSTPFITQDVAIAREAADELALAVQHAQLFEQNQLVRDRMERLSRRLLHVQETERRAIARELHDEIGQALTAIKIELQGLQRDAADVTSVQLTETIEVVDQALQQVRDLSLDLRPSLLDDLGLPAALRWYVDRQAQRAGLSAELNVETVRERLTPDLETVCFRVVQEAVTNIIRHAHAQRIYVELVRGDGQLLLTIQDDGRGFEVPQARAQAAAGSSLGLLGMEERIRLSSGEIEFESIPGRGTTVRARLPFRRRDAAYD